MNLFIYLFLFYDDLKVYSTCMCISAVFSTPFFSLISMIKKYICSRTKISFVKGSKKHIVNSSLSLLYDVMHHEYKHFKNLQRDTQIKRICF